MSFLRQIHLCLLYFHHRIHLCLLHRIHLCLHFHRNLLGFLFHHRNLLGFHVHHRNLLDHPYYHRSFHHLLRHVLHRRRHDVRHRGLPPPGLPTTIRGTS